MADLIGQQVFDLRGLRCPLPVLRLRKLSEGLVAGTSVQVLATDRLAARDIPTFAALKGWTVLSVDWREDGAVVIGLVV
jgi:tRNA 2-thiouridine synthesizing protein A